jgi:hypothetical protein
VRDGALAGLAETQSQHARCLLPFDDRTFVADVRSFRNVPGTDSCTAANWRWLAGEMAGPDYLWLVRGKTILNSVKNPGFVSTSMLPPCCFTMTS